MSTLTIAGVAGSNTFTVISATAISFNGTVYEDVTDIAFPDGTHKTCADIISAAGGNSYTASELKACVKVQGYDPDNNGRQVFLAYSSNSRQTAKNSVASVDGGLTVDVFDFKGDPTTNYILKMWQDAYYPNGGAPNPLPVANSVLIGFKLNYGTAAEHSYTLTQSNQFQEESIPSPPVNIDVTMMHDAQITGKFVAPAPVAGANLYVPIAVFKLYRAAVTSDGQFVYQRVPADPVSTGAPFVPQPFPLSVYGVAPGNYVTAFSWKITDTFTDAQLVETLPSLDWDAPPTRTLKGLTAWRNGMMAAYADNLVYFCEPFRPFTFPGKYVKALPVNVVGLRIDENALIAVTEGEPYMFNGSHPNNIVYERLQGVQAGIKPNAVTGGFINPTRALVRTPVGVIYASKEGPVLVQGGRAGMMWRQLFTRDEWQGRYGALFGSMRLAYFDGRVLCYFENSTTPGFLISVDGEDPQMTEFVPPAGIVADFVLPQTDSMYVVTGGGAISSIARFGDETVARQACSYWTADNIQPRPCNMGVIQLVGLGTAQAQTYADGNPVGNLLTFNLASPTNPNSPGQQTIRLPDGFKARRWSVSLTLFPGTVVSEVYLAETALDLKAV